MVHDKGYTLNEYYLVDWCQRLIGAGGSQSMVEKFCGRVLWCATDGMFMP